MKITNIKLKNSVQKTEMSPCSVNYTNYKDSIRMYNLFEWNEYFAYKLTGQKH